MISEKTYKKLMESLKLNKSSAEASIKWLEKLAEESGLESIPSPMGETSSDSFLGEVSSSDENVVEGMFDGRNMIDTDGNSYPVPSNYASKSKLVQGDTLKLTIAPNGAFIFKQIRPIPRKMLIGDLVLDNSQYKVLADGKSFNVLFASVSFHKAQVGDKLTIIVSAEEESEWAAIENLIPRGTEV